MITKNYRALLAALIAPRNALVGFTDYSGIARTVHGTPQSSAFPCTVYTDYASSANSAGIKLGTGITPATADDYNLESLITSGLGVTVSQRARLEGGNPTSVYTIGVTNNGDEAVTIGEVGFFQRISYTSSSYAVAMLDRTVLDAPLRIPAGESATITYTLKSIVGD